MHKQFAGWVRAIAAATIAARLAVLPCCAVLCCAVLCCVVLCERVSFCDCDVRLQCPSLHTAISEHVENAGVHSGDATVLLPAQKLYVETSRQVKRMALQIAKALRISGPFNIQFMARDNEIKVIECNLRASRTFPFISKTFDFNFIELATKIMLGKHVKRVPFNINDLDYVGCKVPMFSFTRLQGADPKLGVEMASTGEVACFGRSHYEAYLKVRALPSLCVCLYLYQYQYVRGGRRVHVRVRVRVRASRVCASVVGVCADTGSALCRNARGSTVRGCGGACCWRARRKTRVVFLCALD